MQNFSSYIAKSLEGLPQSKALLAYQLSVAEKMAARANEIAYTGLSDYTVLNDLVCSEFPDLKQDFLRYQKAERRQKRRKLLNHLMLFGTIGIVLLLVLIFLGIGFTLHVWTPTWVLLVSGVLCWSVFPLGVFTSRLSRRGWKSQMLARLCLALAMQSVAGACFFLLAFVWHIPHAWLFFLGGVLGAFAADLLYAYCTKQKLRILQWLVYIPAAAPLLYVILCTVNVLPWHPGWLLMPASVLMDVVLIVVRLMQRAKQTKQMEVDAE